jgi:SAM-dependent methyltransferase
VSYSDSEILVAIKPAGVTPSDRTGRAGPTLIDAAGALHGGQHRFQPRLAFSPSREASGLAVLVQSKRAFEGMHGLRSGMQRTHLALLEGSLGAPGATGGFQAEAALGEKSRAGGRKGTVIQFRVIETGQGLTLAQVRAKTHDEDEIRTRLAAAGHPVAGDRAHGATVDPLGRLGLHVWEIGLDHPKTRRGVRCRAPAPEFWRAVGATPPAQEVAGEGEDARKSAGGTAPVRRADGPDRAEGGRTRSEERPSAAALDQPGEAGEARDSQPRDTSWEEVARWYDQLLDERGSDLYERVILPGVERLLRVEPGMGVLDVACGQGIAARRIAVAGAHVVGVDVSESLIEAARARSVGGVAGADTNHAGDETDAGEADSRGRAEYHVGDARKLGDVEGLALGEFDRAMSVMALTNIDPLAQVFEGVARALKPEGAFVFVISHPAFRVIRNSSWGWDAKAWAQYRRVDAYMSPMRQPVQMHPGAAPDVKTWTFHRPLQDYVAALSRAGLMVEALEEWTSPRASDSGPRAREENRIRGEIPMFVAVRAVRAEGA